ncbi:MAG: hypothetical protein HYR56_31665 [Acidobacteria bacterium]|nr:hypothetical protein [Acidobacteriota bacterium]MBI3425929.1 hypothetical protein [Acidobacteriota bacterium]
MSNSVFEYIRQIFTLTEAQQRTQHTVKELQGEVRELTRTMGEQLRRNENTIERLAFEVQRLRDELHYAKQHEADQREKFQLRIENKLLKAGLRLPPANERDKENEE